MKNPVEHMITFGNDRYHQHIDMCIWCAETLGYGKWLTGTPKTWIGLAKLKWCISSQFGNITFAFKNERDFTMFLLRWS